MNQHSMRLFKLGSSGPTSLLDHVASVERERERAQGFLERFREACQVFVPGSTVEQIAEELVGASRRITGAEFAALFVHGDMAFQATAALRGEFWKGQVSTEKGVVEASSIIVAEMEVDNSKKALFKFLHIIPLNWMRSVIGYWAIGDRYSTSLSEDTIDMVSLLAHHAEVAIANAILMKRLEHMANTDHLTGLANRRRFHDELNAQLGNAARDGEQLSLILIDVDHFKDINDRFGHPAGDNVLNQLATILQRAVRGQHLVARYGGEEFAILMERTHRQHGWAMAEHIRHAVATGILNCETGELTCTISLGVASFPEDAPDMPQLIARADRALYLAKRAGRNQTALLPRDGNGIISVG